MNAPKIKPGAVSTDSLSPRRGEGWRRPSGAKWGVVPSGGSTRDGNSPKNSRLEPLNCGSRRKEARTALPEFQMEPPHVGCYMVAGKFPVPVWTCSPAERARPQVQQAPMPRQDRQRNNWQGNGFQQLLFFPIPPPFIPLPSSRKSTNALSGSWGSASLI
jgi:hypothetical protein